MSKKNNKSSNNKIKLLTLSTDIQGVGHFRSIWPIQTIKKNHSDKFEVNFSVTPNLDVEYLSQFDIIHFHRALGPYEGSEKLFKELKERGVALICDIDDYWSPPSTHPLYDIIKSSDVDKKIKRNLELSEYITTTTELFANQIRKEIPGAKVFVIPNALNLEDKMWQTEVEENKSGKVRVSWIGGSSHLTDLQLLEPSFKKLNSSQELKDKFQIILCGFDTRGTTTAVHPDGSRRTRKIEPHESVWAEFEEIFTSNYNLLIDDPEYVKWLKKYKKEELENEHEKNYIRKWTRPLTKYGYHYDHCDVCLAPIAQTAKHMERHPNGKFTVKTVDHTFNLVKSELKIIEAGVKKKVLIAQDFGVYKELLKHNKTGLLVSDNKKGWYKEIRRVIEDADLRNELANNLHEWVMDNYTIEKVTEKRVKIYEEILRGKVIK